MSELLDRAQALLPAMVDSLEALVCMESPSSDVELCEDIVQEAIGIFAAWLPSPSREEMHGGRPVWRWGPRQPRVLLLGHLDTVWPHGTLERIPFSSDGERMTGPGVFDMKAGIVQGWAALALAEVDDESGIGMMLPTDEEIGSHASRSAIADAIAKAEAVLVLEPSVDGALKNRRKGTSWYRAELAGRAAHAGLDPERGINALLGAAEFALAAPGWARIDDGTTVTPTLFHAGTTSNTVPAHAEITLDVRAWTRDEQVRVDALVRGWRPAAGAVTIHGGIDRPALEDTASAALLATARRVAGDLGLPEVQARAVGGASDGNLTAAAGVPTLDGLGAVGDGAHAEHEWVSVPAMAERAALVAGLLGSLLTAEGMRS